MSQPIQIFIAYSRKDTDFLEELRTHLNPLVRSGNVHIWYDGKIEPGAVWEKAIKEHLHNADIILLMVSADAIISDYFYEKEMSDALARHHAGEARVVPLIVRSCLWQATPLKDLQALPKDGRPVSSWPIRDDAYNDAVSSLWTLISNLNQEKREEGERLGQERGRKEEDARQQKEEELSAKHKAPQKKLLGKQKTLQENARQQQIEAERLEQLEADRKKQAELERQHNEVARQRRKEQTASFWRGVRSPWAWGTVLLLVVIFVFFKFFYNQTGDDSEKPLPSDQETTRKSGFEMVPVKGGVYIMGSSESEQGRGKDECQRSVTVGDFSIGKYEVTQVDWREVMGSNPSRFKNCDDCPVVNISWDDIQDFLEVASKKHGKIYRLPTEEEWEYAARGGAKSKGYRYSGSNNLDSVAWHNGNSGDKTHPVGMKSSNELDIYGMSGNVREWCADEWAAYPGCNASDEEGYRVLRGGSWQSSSGVCRSANRGRWKPDYRSSRFGFRLVSVL